MTLEPVVGLSDVITGVRRELELLVESGHTGTVTIHVGVSEYQIVVNSYGKKYRRPRKEATPEAPAWK